MFEKTYSRSLHILRHNPFFKNALTAAGELLQSLVCETQMLIEAVEPTAEPGIAGGKPAQTGSEKRRGTEAAKAAALGAFLLFHGQSPLFLMFLYKYYMLSERVQ